MLFEISESFEGYSKFLKYQCTFLFVSYTSNIKPGNPLNFQGPKRTGISVVNQAV